MSIASRQLEFSDAKDVAFENDLLQDPYNLKNWWYYLEYKAEASSELRYMIYERCLRKLPRSYKMWHKYLTERKFDLASKCITDADFTKTNNAYERALVHMGKMPVMWKHYLQFLMLQKKISLTRHTFDRALRALPITQHLKWVWPLYLEFAQTSGVPEMAIRVFRRYLKIDPSKVEDLIVYLKKANRPMEAAQQLAKLVNDDKFVSVKGRSKHDLWTDLLNLVTKNPKQIDPAVLNVEAIIRGGIRRFPHEVGMLWNSLADYFIRLGHFEKARDVYEEGIDTVNTVRDFSTIYDAYTHFEESVLSARVQMADERAANGNDDEEEEEEDVDSDNDDDIEIDLRLLRLEELTRTRPLLLNSVMLRQNPHNVSEWLTRVQWFAVDNTDTQNNAKQRNMDVIKTYTEAVTTVDPQQATGKPHVLWIKFARFYEDQRSLANARVILTKAADVNYKNVDDLASVWCAHAEMELRHDNFDKAREVMREATVLPQRKYRQYKKGGVAHIPVQKRLYRSTKLWSLRADLEEHFGTLESTKEVYEEILAAHVATPQLVLNYALLLEERKYFEDSFRAYEKGVALFSFPHVYPIWLAYLKKFVERYKGKKLERTRDLFNEAVDKAPAKEARTLYLLFAKFEEDYGLARRAMAVYDRACEAVEVTARFDMYIIYINRCTEFFGVTKTREIYDKAIQNLPDSDLKHMCMRYASLERKLGEIDRARAVYSYASQYCNPLKEQGFWKVWHDFEVSHGNEDTFRDMLRVRRSVQAQFSQNSMMSTSADALAGKRKEAPTGDALEAKRARSEALNPMEQLDAQQRAAEEEKQAQQAKAMEAAQNNTEEIDLDMDDDDEDDDDDDVADVVQQSVPDAVFGAAAASMGAKERFAAKKA